MADARSALHQLGAMDQVARLDTPIHRLDPRAKIIATLVFVIVAVSYGKYEIAAMLPLVFFPIALGALGGIPAWFVIQRVLVALPFVLFVGIFNPLLDRTVVLRLGTLDVAGGWVSLASILFRSTLTVGAALLLVATTGMAGICAGLTRLGVPRVFAVQLLFLYRYLFVLGDEATRLLRARSLRSFGGRGMGLRAASSLLGHLLLRTIDRAERIHVAMRSRGFDGEVRLLRRPRFGPGDALFVAGWSGFFVAARIWNVPALLGAILIGGIG